MNYLSIVSLENCEEELVRVFCTNEDQSTFQYVYRTGTSVSWNSALGCFESQSHEIGFIEAFSRILSAVQSELDILLTLKSNTKYRGLSPDILTDLIFCFFDFQVEHFPSFDLVYVEDDSSVRELTIDERIYLKTKYHGGDGDRPYIKSNFKELDGNGSISGFCFRNCIPSNLSITRKCRQIMKPNLIDQLQRIAAMKYKIDFKELEYVEEIIRLTLIST